MLGIIEEKKKKTKHQTNDHNFTRTVAMALFLRVLSIQMMLLSDSKQMKTLEPALNNVRQPLSRDINILNHCRNNSARHMYVWPWIGEDSQHCLSYTENYLLLQNPSPQLDFTDSN